MSRSLLVCAIGAPSEEPSRRAFSKRCRAPPAAEYLPMLPELPGPVSSPVLCLSSTSCFSRILTCKCKFSMYSSVGVTLQSEYKTHAQHARSHMMEETRGGREAGHRTRRTLPDRDRMALSRCDVCWSAVPNFDFTRPCPPRFLAAEPTARETFGTLRSTATCVPSGKVGTSPRTRIDMIANCLAFSLAGYHM